MVNSPTVRRGKLCRKRLHDEWYVNGKYYKCAPCSRKGMRALQAIPANRVLAAARGKAWRAANPEKQRAATRASAYRLKYGITVEDYDRMLAEQGGECALCRRRPTTQRRLAVDHDHGSGAVRQLLCTPCNRGLGYLEHPAWFANATDYLKRHHPERYLD